MGPLETLPYLQGPPEAGFITGSYSGSGGLRYAIAVLATALSAADLEAHYARQLTAAGWQRRETGACGPLAWSVWDTTLGIDFQGYLWVLEEPGKPRRTVYLQAGSDFVKPAPPHVLEHIRRAGNTIIT